MRTGRSSHTTCSCPGTAPTWSIGSTSPAIKTLGRPCRGGTGPPRPAFQTSSPSPCWTPAVRTRSSAGRRPTCRTTRHAARGGGPPTRPRFPLPLGSTPFSINASFDSIFRPSTNAAEKQYGPFLNPGNSYSSWRFSSSSLISSRRLVLRSISVLNRSASSSMSTARWMSRLFSIVKTVGSD